MEETIFPLPAVAAALEGYVEARLHTDGGRGAEYRKLQDEMVGVPANPSYAVVDPETGKVLKVHRGWMPDEAKFAAWLREVAR